MIEDKNMWQVIASVLLLTLIPAQSFAAQVGQQNTSQQHFEPRAPRIPSQELAVIHNEIESLKTSIGGLTTVINKSQSESGFLNRNANTITALATVLLAVFTFIYVRLTNKLVKHTKSQAEALLEEHNNALKREIIEKIYRPLIEELWDLTNVDSFRGNCPQFTFWVECKHKESFLAYRVRPNISEALDKLSERWSEFESAFSKLVKSIREIAAAVFDTSPTVYDNDIHFQYNNNQKNHIALTILLYRTYNADLSIESLFEGSAVKYAAKHGTSKELSFNEFSSTWTRMEDRIKQSSDIRQWLNLYKECRHEAERIMDLIENDRRL